MARNYTTNLKRQLASKEAGIHVLQAAGGVSWYLLIPTLAGLTGLRGAALGFLPPLIIGAAMGWTGMVLGVIATLIAHLGYVKANDVVFKVTGKNIWGWDPTATIPANVPGMHDEVPAAQSNPYTGEFVATAMPTDLPPSTYVPPVRQLSGLYNGQQLPDETGYGYLNQLNDEFGAEILM